MRHIWQLGAVIAICAFLVHLKLPLNRKLESLLCRSNWCLVGLTTILPVDPWFLPFGGLMGGLELLKMFDSAKVQQSKEVARDPPTIILSWFSKGLASGSHVSEAAQSLFY